MTLTGTICIPKSLEFLNWSENEELKIKKIAVVEKRKNIKELFENFDGIYKKEDIDWGESVGKEA